VTPPGYELLEKSKLDFQHNLLFELIDFVPILRRLGYILKLMNEHHESILPSLKEIFTVINFEVKRDLSDISEKFKGQVQQLIIDNQNIEENIPLQDRIKKASRYFSEKLELILINKLKDIDIGIDNKTVKKSVNDAIVKLSEDITVKHACLKDCADGFNLKRYMEIRAKAAIEPSDKKLKNKPSTFSTNDFVAHPELYKILRAWCNQKADELNVDTYMILPYKALVELTEQLPASIAELKRVKGFGSKKVSQFGKEIVEIVTAYRIKMNLPDTSPIIEPPIKIKIPKVDSKLISLQLFKDGKSTIEIAKEREMAVSTIEEHLSHFIENGEIGLEKLMNSEKIALISDWYLHNPMPTLGPAKAELGENVSYSELRLVLKYLIYTKQITV
jgi:hypothetical protein